MLSGAATATPWVPDHTEGSASDGPVFVFSPHQRSGSTGGSVHSDGSQAAGTGDEAAGGGRVVGGGRVAGSADTLAFSALDHTGVNGAIFASTTSSTGDAQWYGVAMSSSRGPYPDLRTTSGGPSSVPAGTVLRSVLLSRPASESHTVTVLRPYDVFCAQARTVLGVKHVSNETV